MIKLSEKIQDILSQSVFTSFHLVAVRNQDSPIFLTDHFSDLVYMGDTYQANSGLVSIDLPISTNIVDRAEYKFVYLDSDLSTSLWLESANLTGTLVSIYMGLIDPETDLPLTAPGDVITVYEGFIDTTPRKIDLKEYGGAVVEVLLTSPIANLDRKRTVITSDEFMRGQVSGDTCFNQVHEGSRAVVVRWGKI
jgi:hypothetical protein